jgi:hypothetical protein
MGLFPLRSRGLRSQGLSPCTDVTPHHSRCTTRPMLRLTLVSRAPNQPPSQNLHRRHRSFRRSRHRPLPASATRYSQRKPRKCGLVNWVRASLLGAWRNARCVNGSSFPRTPIASRRPCTWQIDDQRWCFDGSDPGDAGVRSKNSDERAHTNRTHRCARVCARRRRFSRMGHEQLWRTICRPSIAALS